jgi:hypothetical protein
MLDELTKQHRELRAMMDRCEALADALDAGGLDPGPLVREVERLRVAFGAHNAFEERLLRPLLYAHDAFATARIDQLIEEHVAEHRAMRAQLHEDAPTASLRDVIATLRAHLDAEDQYVLTSSALRHAGKQPSM